MDNERNDIYIRRATTGDINTIMRVLECAKARMRLSGNTMQWSDGYPSRDIIEADIAAGNSYAGIAPDGDIVLTFAFIIGEDPTYAVIEDGEWPDNRPYGTIHRIGATERYHGMLRQCVDFCLAFADTLRLDTHKDNILMRTAAERLGFRHCGTIYCCDGTPRMAYHRANNCTPAGVRKS